MTGSPDTTGRGGARGGIDSVVRTLQRTGAHIADQTVAVPYAMQAFDDDLVLADPRLRAEVAALMAGLADRARTTADLAA